MSFDIINFELNNKTLDDSEISIFIKKETSYYQEYYKINYINSIVNFSYFIKYENQTEKKGIKKIDFEFYKSIWAILSKINLSQLKNIYIQSSDEPFSYLITIRINSMIKKCIGLGNIREENLLKIYNLLKNLIL